MGDAEKPELTKQFNEGYKTDLAEPGEAGFDVIKVSDAEIESAQPAHKSAAPIWCYALLVLRYMPRRLPRNGIP